MIIVNFFFLLRKYIAIFSNNYSLLERIMRLCAIKIIIQSYIHVNIHSLDNILNA